MRYRPDIDGLRAVAVASVVAYHADHRWLPGGFTGVDVFFVISGYLITQLIAEDLERTRFTLAHFYERRARRILPALCLVLVAASIGAVAWLLPAELERFGASLVATSFFVSNFWFWSRTDYFAAPPDATPLLHTWSLAVEEQFYLLFPLVLVALMRMPRGTRAALLWTALLGSLLLAEWGAREKPIAAFYLGPTRAWELLCGVVLALRLVPALRSRALAEASSLAGLGAIVAGFVLLSEDSRFPGFSALLPCLGAALVIHAGERHATLLSRALSLGPVVFVGLISYSLYLWHWVVLVFARHLAMRELAVVELLTLVAASVFLAMLSWRFVERPFRRRARRPASDSGASPGARPVLMSAAAASLVLAACGAGMLVARGFPERLTPSALAFADGQKRVWERRSECEGKLCELGTAAAERPAVLLWGDSHAASLAPAVSDLAAARELRAIVAFKESCPPLVGYRDYGRLGKDCTSFTADVLQRVREERTARVILHARWPWYVEGTRNEEPTAARIQLDPDDFDPALNAQVLERLLRQTIARLRTEGASVTLVTSIPEVGVDAPELLARRALRRAPLPHVEQARFEARTARSHAAIEAAASSGDTSVHKSPSADVLHLFPALCRNRRCNLAHENRALYYDDDHLSLEGARYVRYALAPALGAAVVK